MKQEVQITLTLEVDADQSISDIERFVKTLINTHTLHSSTINRMQYSKLELTKILEEKDLYNLEDETV